MAQGRVSTFFAPSLAVCAPLPAGCACLHPLYSDLDCGKPVKIEKLLEEYTYSLSSDRRLNALTGAVGNALVSAGLAREARGGLFGGKTRYIPQDEAINRVQQMMDYVYNMIAVSTALIAVYH